ncbi:autotransporter-associated beta strand repeat-containing protein, partial [Bradyrhizobium sp.]|uniref:autotransporter-associated beta strand repeat-containing protein n=1 Tax=Bradyrhizobium sp. TaxID=376 RepID=UPI001ED6516B
MRQVFLASSALVVVASSAQAQTLTWDPSGTAGVQGGAGTWQGPAGNTNWTDTGGATNRAWANDASAVFGTAGGTVTVDTSGGAVSFGGMTFNSSGYTISGNALTVASGGATISSSGIDATINSRLTGNGALTISNTVGGIISLTNNANDYSGGTVLSFARVGVGANNVFGSGSISASDALFISLVDGLTISNSVSLGGLQVRIDTGAFETEYSGQLAGATRITKLGSGTLVLSNATNSIPGGFDLGAGTIATTSAAALGSGPILIESGATLQARGSMTLANTFSLGSGAVFDTQANTMTLNGVLQNSLGVGSLVKNGTGTLSLTNTNTYSGGTTINAGVIEANHVTGVYIDALGTGAVTFNGGTLRNMAVDDRLANNIVLGAGGGTIDNSTGGFITLEGNITGSGNFTKTGSAVVRVQGVNDYSGATLVSAGSLRASSSTGFSANSAYTLAAGTSLELAGNSNSIGSLAGAGTVTNNGLAATLTVGANNSSTEFSGALTDGFSSVSRTALTKIGTGTLTLSGASSATGLVTVNAGTLNIAAGGSIAAGTEVNGGLLTVNGTAASVTVNSGGTLGGTGTVGTTAINGGTLAPGNSIGTISVAGNLGFTSASIYAVEVSPSAADRTNAT